VNEVRAERVEIVEIEALEQRQLLEQNRALAPRAAFRDSVAAIIEGERRFDGSFPAREIVAGQQSAMTAPGDVKHLFVPAEPVDRLGDKAAIPGIAGALDLAFARTIPGLAQDAAVGRGERWVAEQPPGLRRLAMREINRG
jgi:hypothetical protein